MRTSMKCVAFTLALACGGALGLAQEIRVEQSVSGDFFQFPGAGRELKTGTGQIRGRVFALDTGSPIRRAQVRISGQEILPKAALTDAEGRFEFRDLPAGRFTLQASKSGFVSVGFGQTRPYESGRPIELADKQVLENSDIAMPRGSVIAGRILDEFGEPMPDVSVTALRQSWSNGRRRLVPAAGRLAQTNDLGQFRLFGLPPGEYFLSATIRGAMVEMMAVEMMAARGVGGTGPSASTPTSGYAPTYYPGTSNVGEAQKITLMAGQEHQGADFSLMPVRLATITGVVIGSDGKPLSGAMINVTPRERSATTFLSGLTGARTNQDGAFTLNGVAPGDYQLQANSVQVITSDEGGNRMVFAMRTGPGGSGPDAESGSLPLSVAGEDVSNVVLVTSKGARATGRVTFEDGAQPPNLGSIRISAPAIDSADGFMGGGGFGRVQADGSFELTGLSGARLVRAVGLPPGWTLKAVRLDGTDITDAGAEFKAGAAVSGLEVVLTSRTTMVTGGVSDGAGSPLKDYTVVIFADDPELWGLPMTRWVTGTRPDQEGRFKVQHLPPGSYHAVAVEYVPQGEWGDPDLLERLKGKGKRFTLGEGGNEVVDLKVAVNY